ncbi:MAG TPA: hypothetical protein VER55_11440 [Ardenticatenaceae bacterium]|nr:hypothetical protein [Ardenticatenaceae bacterium]
MKTCCRLIVFVALAALVACSDGSPPTAVTVAEVCQQEAGTRVMAEGRLALPTFMTCTGGQCQISLYDETDSVFVEFVASDRPGNNGLKLPPEQYTEDDLSVVLADGSVADRATPVRITGVVRRPSNNACYLDVHSAERR